MVPIVITLVSVFIITVIYILLKAVFEKPCCSVIITALSAGDIAELIASAGSSKADSVYIVTNRYDEKYFKYLEKHYLIKEVLTVVDGDT